MKVLEILKTLVSNIVPKILELILQWSKDFGSGVFVGVSGMWEAVQLVGKEFSLGCQAVFEVSTLRNMGQLITWSAFLVVFPKVAEIFYNVLTKNLPKYLFGFGKE